MKTILVDAWNTFVTPSGINKALYKLLESYDERKIIVTNANEAERVKLKITDMPYPVFSLSHDPDKTNPLYFKKLMQHYNTKNDELIYFEHNLDAVNSAKSVNIISHYYKSDKPIELLKEFLDNNL